MKKKKLTINTLALANLRNRKKQYTIMIIGIILAMVFSSSIIFVLSSFNSTAAKLTDEYYSKARIIWSNIDEDITKEAFTLNYIDTYGYAHIIGSGFTDIDEDFNAVPIAWLDDTAKDLYNVSFVSGTYPKNENEIAAESYVLSILGIDAKVGDSITINVRTQNGDNTFEEYSKKTYILSGILKNKRNHIDNIGYVNFVPGFIVADNVNTEIGGKEALTLYAKRANMTQSVALQFDEFYHKKISESEGSLILFSDKEYLNTSIDSFNINSIIAFAEIMMVTFMIISAMVIINSFSVNLKERKKQIGMLRAVGTTRRQIISIYSRETFIISLIAAPISILVAYLLMFFVTRFLGPEFIFVPNILVIILAAIFSVLVILLASMIPLISAVKISPIQAIRNVDIVRIKNKKKIKSKKQFKMSNLVAERNLVFSHGKQAIVSIILAVAIIISAYGYSMWLQEKNYSHYFEADYEMHVFTYTKAAINYSNYNTGFSLSDKQMILSNNYVGQVGGTKLGTVNVLTDVSSSPYRKMVSDNYISPQEKFDNPNDVIDFNKNLSKDNFNDYFFKEFYSEYEDTRRALGYDEYISMDYIAVDECEIEHLNKYLLDGSINIDKLNSGEEVIILCPKRVGIYYDKEYESIVVSQNNTDDMDNCIFSAETDFKPGEKITLSALSKKSDEYKDYVEELKQAERKDMDVSIGAVVENEYFFVGVGFNNLAVVTTTQGMEKLINNSKYINLNIYLNTTCNDEIDDEINELLHDISQRIDDTTYSSVYSIENDRDNEYGRMFLILIAILSLFYAVCISIINNFFTSNIRESKSKIGTLRAVGASQKDLIMIYIKQLISMLIWGTSIGFGGYIVSYLIIRFGLNSIPDLPFNPLLAVVFTVITFVICSVNLYTKIHKEMKNSIVENIREL